MLCVADEWSNLNQMWEAITTSIIANLITTVLFNLRLINVHRIKRGYREIRIRGNNQSHINRYLKELFSRASSIDIVSSRLSWIESDSSMEAHITNLSQQGKQFRFHLPDDNIIAKRIRLKRQNIRVFVSKLPILLGEHPRFTLTDRNTPGSGILAVGYSDGREDWLINEFTFRDHPQILAIARGYVESLERTGEEVEC